MKQFKSFIVLLVFILVFNESLHSVITFQLKCFLFYHCLIYTQRGILLVFLVLNEIKDKVTSQIADLLLYPPGRPQLVKEGVF